MAPQILMLVGRACLPLWLACRFIRLREWKSPAARWIEILGLEGLFILLEIVLPLLGLGMWLRSVF